MRNSPATEPVVVYTVNSLRLYWLMLIESVRSLRAHSPDARVVVYAFGPSPRKEASRLKNLGVRLVRRRAVRGPRAYWLKWLVLHELRASRVVLLDVDTIWHCSLQRFSALHSRHDLYARPEIGMGRATRIGRLRISNRLNQAAFERAVGGRIRVPIFNAGVSVWNRGTHRRWAARLPRFLKLAERIGKGAQPQLVTNPFFADEVAAAVALHASPRLRFGKMNRREHGFFLELYAERAVPRGILHVNTGHYLQWLETQKRPPEELRHWRAAFFEAGRQPITYEELARARRLAR